MRESCYRRSVNAALTALPLAVRPLLFALLSLILILGAGRPVVASSGDVDLRIRTVEDGLRMPFVVEGYGEYRTTYNIYERMKYHGVPGVSIGVINGSSIEWAKGYGELEAGTDLAVDTETLFQVASIGKPITATGVLRLVEQGVLDLGKNVNTYLTSWKIPENEFMNDTPVTLEMLLSHTGGVTVHGFPGYPRGASLPTLVQILDGLLPCNTAAVRVDMKPGTQWRYSGGGFVVIQQILEDLLGRPFQESIRQLVFENAGMHRTFYLPILPEVLEENTARAHLADGSLVAGGYHIYPEFGAGGGLWSTPSDLALLVVATQDSYMNRPGSLLSRDTVIEMLAPRVGPHGLGFMVTSKSGEVTLSHAGGNLGYRNLLFAYAETGKGAVIMTNSDAGGGICSEIMRAIAVVYDWPDYQPEKKVPISLPREQLELLAGHYDIPGSGTVPLMVDEGNLYAPDRQTEGGRILFLPESPTSFFSPSSGWLLDFVLDESGGVTGVDVRLDGAKFTGRRLRLEDLGLVAHWALDEAEGDIAYDSAGVNDAVVIGEPLWHPSGGQVDGALEFDGVDNWITARTPLNPADGPFSIFVWVQGGLPGQTVISQVSGADWLAADPLDGALMMALAGSGRSGGPLLSQTVITDGNWHRIGLVWDGLHRTLYVDDIPIAEDTQKGLSGSAGGLNIGCGTSFEPNSFWLGLIDDVRIYNRAVKP